MIECTCGQCGARLEVGDDVAGTIHTCPTCQARLHIPQPGVPAETPPGSPAAGPAGAPAGAPVKALVDKLSLPVILSSLALAAGVAALAMTCLNGPGLPGDGMDGYDFSEPKAAVRSMLEIDVNADVRGELEIMRLKQLADEDAAARLDSLKINSVLTYKDKAVVLFQTTDKDDDTDYASMWLAKADGVYYRCRQPNGYYDWDEEDADSLKGKIYRTVREWERRG